MTCKLILKIFVFLPMVFYILTIDDYSEYEGGYKYMCNMKISVRDIIKSLTSSYNPIIYIEYSYDNNYILSCTINI